MPSDEYLIISEKEKQLESELNSVFGGRSRLTSCDTDLKEKCHRTEMARPAMALESQTAGTCCSSEL